MRSSPVGQWVKNPPAMQDCQVASVVSNSATPWTIACQAPLSMGFSREEYWGGLPLPSSREIFQTQGSNPGHQPWVTAKMSSSLHICSSPAGSMSVSSCLPDMVAAWRRGRRQALRPRRPFTGCPGQIGCEELAHFIPLLPPTTLWLYPWR